MKPFVLAPLALVASSLLGPVPGEVAAGDAVPAHCVAHTTFSDGADLAGDYRCAGLAIPFHTAGASASPSPLWAGQWLFVDEAGHHRMGTCTFNRGTHPTVLVPSRRVPQTFPNDPTGAKGAYLAWRYGTTTDPLVAAGLWAVFHHYALDAAGSNRSANPSAPLVPRLDGIAAASGRADLQAEAIALDAEARAMGGRWSLAVEVVPADSTVVVTLMAGDRPVSGRPVTVLVSGDDVSRTATTGTDGRATVAVSFPPGAVTVAATTDAPGAVEVYRGSPAAPNPLGAQTLAVAGPPRVLRATANAAVAATTSAVQVTSEVTETTTAATDTTEGATDTTTAATDTTTGVTDTTPPAATAPVATSPPTTGAPTTPPPTSIQIAPTTTAPATHPPLPTTGRGGDGAVAQLATAFLVGGIGLLGTLRRRHHAPRNTP